MKRKLILAAKFVVSVAILTFLVNRVVGAQHARDLWMRLDRIVWPWLGVAFLIQLAGITCSVLRWNILLVGQGIHAPLRHLVGSFWIGRFFGTFTPGGWTGLNGYRIYDIARHTGKTARATATIAIEMLLGQVAFGAVVIAGSMFGVPYIGWIGVLIVDASFLLLILGAIALISRPQLFRWLGERLPPGAPIRGGRRCGAATPAPSAPPLSPHRLRTR